MSVEKLVQVMMRISPADAARLRDLAHAARLPLAVFCREALLNKLPHAAPLAPADLPVACASLLKTLAGLASNLSQLKSHARNAGPELAKLASSGGFFKSLGKVNSLALEIKAGRVDSNQAENYLSKIEPLGQVVNDFSHKLNQAQPQSPLAWAAICTAAQQALV